MIKNIKLTWENDIEIDVPDGIDEDNIYEYLCSKHSEELDEALQVAELFVEIDED